MRYYDIALTNATTGKPVMPSSLLATGVSGSQPTSITSLLPTSTPSNQLTNPAALDIELDIPCYPYHSGGIGQYVRIFGLGLQDLGSALDLNPGQVLDANGTPQFLAPNVNIVVKGGMARGYPLANPRQQGILTQGSILQAFGNWLGTEMTLDLIVGPWTGLQSSPANFVFNWMPGASLATAIKNTLTAALPNMKVNIAISPNLATNYQQAGYYPTLVQFAQTLQEMTVGKLGATYGGIHVATKGQTVVVYDTDTLPSPKPISIAFQDLIGQITWYAPQQMMVKLVMRGDLDIGDVIYIPPTAQLQTAAALQAYRDRTTFTGFYQIQQMQHWGRFRQPDAQSWNTTLWCTPLSKQQAAQLQASQSSGAVRQVA